MKDEESILSMILAMQVQKHYREQFPILTELSKLIQKRYPGPSIGWKWPSEDSENIPKEVSQSKEEIETEQSAERRKEIAKKR
jgi:hypothetical protein